MKQKESQLAPGETAGYFFIFYTSVAEDVNFAQRRTNPARGQDGIQLYSGLLEVSFAWCFLFFQHMTE